ncbi:MAG: hydroxymethylglutaryl-CoA synthase [Acidimicrobiaceae bacterium]|nr:hydroxymethylglutaryl-CoA synthase [Acidimicrobiaceae bacterium]MBT5849591.1 hydroxymethylglutaryl-CoA synthase [Acidimicrobiaceae bacterium]
MTRGILGYGVHVPHYRLQRSAIGTTLGAGGGTGTRAVASYDEDATSMSVEAARVALRSFDAPTPAAVYFSSVTPPYLDKTNANAIHAALNYPSEVFAGDMVGSARSTTAALTAALNDRRPVLVTSSDVRTGRPGSGDEASLGDAAAAVMIGSDDDAPVIAEWIGTSSATHEFLDRWREPGWNYSRVWEERFGESVYKKLVVEAATTAFKETELSAADIDTVVISGLHARAVRSAAAAAGVAAVPSAKDLTATIGNTGSAHGLVSLAQALDTAEPNETLMLINLADGCDVSIFRTTDAISGYTPARPVALQVEQGNDSLEYAKFLTWRGFLDREPPRRPDPESPAGPPSERNTGWKFALIGSRDRSTGNVYLPPQRVALEGGAVDDYELVSMADVEGTVATFTIDHLAFSPSPPTLAVVVDFDGGGRFMTELTDADADDVHIGLRVRMTFRKVLTANGVHNYFWKAIPVR